jgi:hypothetical protein
MKIIHQINDMNYDNDVVVFVYRHLYHPWCALIYFKQKSKCADPHCKTNMSLEWFKNFGFRKFEKDLLERKIFEGYEESWLQPKQGLVKVQAKSDT